MNIIFISTPRLGTYYKRGTSRLEVADRSDDPTLEAEQKCKTRNTTIRYDDTMIRCDAKRARVDWKSTFWNLLRLP
jgi:hypothetical protein